MLVNMTSAVSWERSDLTTLQPFHFGMRGKHEASFCLFSQGPNALVTYTIISGADDSFRIDPESGDLIATKKLDRERRSKYSLLVRADDGKQSSDMRLNITVKDVNDHSPKFSRATYSFDIPEDMAAGKSWLVGLTTKFFMTGPVNSLLVSHRLHRGRDPGQRLRFGD